MKFHEGVVEEDVQQLQLVPSAHCNGQSVQALPHVPDDDQGLKIGIISNDLEMPVGSKPAANPHWTEDEQFVSKVLGALAIQVLVTLAIIYASRRLPTQLVEQTRFWCSLAWAACAIFGMGHIAESTGQRPMSWIGVLLLTCINDVLVAGVVAGSNSEVLLVAVLVTLVWGLALATLACKWSWHKPQYCQWGMPVMALIGMLGMSVSFWVGIFAPILHLNLSYSMFLTMALCMFLLFNSMLLIHTALSVFGPPDYCSLDKSWNSEGFVDAAMLLHTFVIIWSLPWWLLLITILHNPTLLQSWLGW